MEECVSAVSPESSSLVSLASLWCLRSLCLPFEQSNLDHSIIPDNQWRDIFESFQPFQEILGNFVSWGEARCSAKLKSTTAKTY